MLPKVVSHRFLATVTVQPDFWLMSQNESPAEMLRKTLPHCHVNVFSFSFVSGTDASVNAVAATAASWTHLHGLLGGISSHLDNERRQAVSLYTFFILFFQA